MAKKHNYVKNPSGMIVCVNTVGSKITAADMLKDTVGQAPPVIVTNPETGEVTAVGGFTIPTDQEVKEHLAKEKEAKKARQERIDKRRKENAAIVINQVTETK